jgi:hypothetical protein
MTRVLPLAALLLASCATAENLPPVEVPDQIRVERNYPKQLLAELKDPGQIEGVVAFINSKPSGWSVPWYGPPVGQVYLSLLKKDKVTANFYVGPWFFGRDHGNFWSQKATEQEVMQLEKLLGVPLVEIVKSAQPK